MTISLGYWLLWAATVVFVGGLAVAIATRRLRPTSILTAAEWRLAAQIVGIVVMLLIIIYFQNAHRYDAKGFIYGRF